MNRQSLSNLKDKIKSHLPETAVIAGLVGCAVATAVYLNKKTPETKSPFDETLPDNILVLEQVDDDIYTDLDWPGVMYSVTVVS